MTGSESHFLLEPEAVKLLRQFNIPYPDHALARSAEEAGRQANALGYPVVLKAVSPQVIHKSDVGGVVVGLETVASVRAAYEQMIQQVAASAPEAQIEGALVVKQAPPGQEVIVGATHDAAFGPVVMFGLGGVFAEVLKDVAFRIAPLRRRDAEAMIREIRGYPLLAGARGRSPCDVEALAALLLTVSDLVTRRSEITELDLNPVRLYERGLVVLDVRMLTNIKEEV
jgi:acyl-CoA synthetase (NDP forming)